MKRKVRMDRILMLLIVVVVAAVILVYFLIPKNESKMIDLTGESVEEIKKYANDNKLVLEIKEESNPLEKGKIVFQNIKNGTVIKENDKLIITISLGINYSELKVDELGNVPIMMYHGVVDTLETEYIGGNVDKDGYHRTKEAFIKDLEFYYSKGYRMIKLNDYINGKIDVKAGLSPIILTFDDGLSNNIKVNGLDKDGNIIIDPNSAVGILESFKKKYPDYNITATFFLNGGLFNQNEYNEKILNWLVSNNYDIGNHSYSHADFSSITEEKASEEISKIYSLLDKNIKGKYVNIVALPFGSPYKKEHANFNKILNNEYKTESTLRVGWESELSPFNKNFDRTFLKRIRAYDNNGKEFDIEMNFKNLEKNKFISDGDINTITISKEKENKMNNFYNLKLITY